MRRWLVLVLLVGARVSAEPPDVPDPSMIPDASVGQGGAQQGSEESDNAAVCMSDADCDRGLKCEQFKCTWQQYRQATFAGCGSTASVGLAAAGLVLVARRKRAGVIR